MVIEELYRLFKESTGIGTDTRKDLQGKLFFALKGENFNGNLYATKAIEAGASYAIVDEISDEKQSNLILVNDVLDTLQELAYHHRTDLGVSILAITGSNGKTTNKELIACVLEKKFQLYYTKGNLNNHIGVPLSLLELASDHNFAVIEMGASKLGDIKELCEIADPDFGYITNIGNAHLEGFISRENIAIGKGELLDYVKAKAGMFFFNGSEKEVKSIVGNYKNICQIDETNDSGLEFELQATSPKVIFEIKFKGVKVNINSLLYGRHNYENLKMAVGIGLFFNVDPADISNALSSYKPSNNRSQIARSGNITLYMDAYNANPSSMAASIKSFQEVEAHNKVLILGDMLELGEQSHAYHQEIIDLIASGNWRLIVLVGENFHKTEKESLSNAYSFLETNDANSFINQNRLDNSHVLVKGSRGQKLESLNAIQHLLASQELMD